MPRLEGLPPIEAVRNNLLDLIERLDPEGEDVLAGVLSPEEMGLLDSAWHLLHSEAQPGRDYRVGITACAKTGPSPLIVCAQDVSFEDAARVLRGARILYTGGEVSQAYPSILTIAAGDPSLQLLIREEHAEAEKAARDQEHAQQIASRAWADLDPEGDAAWRAAELRKDLARFAGMFAVMTGSGLLACPLKGPEAEAWEQGAAEITAGFWKGIEGAQALEAQAFEPNRAQELAEADAKDPAVPPEPEALPEAARYYEAGRAARLEGRPRNTRPIVLGDEGQLAARWLEGWDAADRESEGSADQ